MDIIATFRRQHRQLLKITIEISNLLDPKGLAEDASNIRSLLSHLAGKLSVHLSMEDKYLYPNLLDSKDTRVSSLAKQYIDEMGDIKEVFGAYVKIWPSPTAIQNDPIKFINETKGIFEALQKRIDREDSNLYPLIDSL